MNTDLKHRTPLYYPTHGRLIHGIRLFSMLLVLVVVLAATLLVNTLRFTTKHVEVQPAVQVEVDEAAAAEHLAAAVRLQTISYADDTPVSAEAFRGLHGYLERTFPRVYASLGKETISEHSLLYTWQGRDPTLKPILLLAHLDVVPVETGTAAQWTQPPFDGQIAGGYVWGRGVMDDKSGVLGILEAVELLLSRNVQPARTVYLAFGHDEEIGGNAGAQQIAALMRERNIELEYIIDEGSFITDGILPNLSRPVAMIGVAEKGILNLELSVDGAHGHSSVPPAHTAIGRLSTAIHKLEAHPVPGGIDGVVGEMFRALGPEMPFAQRLVFANLWLFGPLVERQLAASPTSNALMRTTTAVTMIDGGIKENVLPSRARAVVNFRILPGDTSEQIISHVRATIDDPGIKIAPFGSSDSEPSAVSSMDGAGFEVLERTIRQVFPGVLVAPAQVLGATDSRHFAALTDHIFRFRPLRLQPDDVERLHGTDERVAVENYAQIVRFYYQLIGNAAQ